METGPRPLIERFVSALIPPPSREHVLGDLRQRNRSEGEFVLDACRVVPYVVWSQVRRTASPQLLAAEFALVYGAFASAAVSVIGFFSRPFAVYQLAIPAAIALVTLVLRDAYAAGKRSAAEVAGDASLAVMAILVAEQVLLAAGSGLALPRAVSIGGAVASLLGISAIRRLAHERAVGPKSDATASIQSRAVPQKDLNKWWWSTAVLGLMAWAFFFGHQPFRQFRPLLITWLFLFVGIGLYQRRKIYWPHRASGSNGGRHAYRAALIQQRDAQSKWPFRRGSAFVVVIAAIAGSDERSRIPRMNLALAIYAFVVTGWLLYGRLLTNRAARDFDRELALLDSEKIRPEKP